MELGVKPCDTQIGINGNCVGVISHLAANASGHSPAKRIGMPLAPAWSQRCTGRQVVGMEAGEKPVWNVNAV
jgi:hypothetical protein